MISGIPRLTLIATLAVSAMMPVRANAASTASLLSIDDYGQVKSTGVPQLSPDGKLVLFSLEDRIYIVPTGGGDKRAVTPASSKASEPRWSRDGTSIYFLSDRSGTRQLWKLTLESFAEAERLSDIERGVNSLNLSHDGSRLLLSYEDEADGGDEDEARKEPWVIDRLQFKEDAGDGYLTARPSDHLYLYDIAGKKLAPLTSGEYAEEQAAWSPDDSAVVFVSSREDDPDVSYRNDLWIVSTAAANGASPLRHLTDDDDVKSSPAYSPDGKSVAYLSAEDGVYGINRLTIVPASGGTPDVLTAELDRWVTSFRFSGDGKSIYFLFENRGARHLARITLRDGRVERLLGGDRYISEFDINRRNEIVVRSSSGNGAADLYRVAGKKLQPLTHLNDGFFSSHSLGHKEKITYTVDDGTEVDAFVTRPPNFDPERRYPTILHIHGGPVGQFSWGFDFRAEFFAANGYVVVQPNPRGSNGRGQEFVRAIYQSWGITDYPDVIGAIDRVIELGYADPDRLAVTGYSYGGYMTNVVITGTDRFQAAATGAGHSLIAANYGHDIYQKWYNWELGLPSRNRAKYDRLSPFTRVDRVVTPTLFLGGRDDWNVPILNAELMYQALRHRGIDSRLVVYPGTHHGDWEERFDRDYLERVIAWFDRYTGRETN